MGLIPRCLSEPLEAYSKVRAGLEKELPMSLLEASHLRKSYNGKPAVDDVSFSVDTGEIFGLLGPNGAGKSTTMMMLAGLLEPDAGTIHIGGRSFSSDGAKLRRDLGVVPQDLAIYPDLTARENLDFFAAIYAVRRADRIRRIAFVLEVIGLETQADALVKTFSGGMKRRLNLGVALLHEPKLLILDEPTVGVDPQSRSHILERIGELSQNGMAVLYASHYMEEVQAICDRVAILDHGRIVASDHLKGLLQRVHGQVELLVSSWRPEVEDRFEGLGKVSVTSAGDARIVLKGTSDNGSIDLNRSLSRALEILRECRVTVRSVETRESNLERLFLELTGRTLRD